MTGDWAIVPVKGLTESKTRLSPYLGERRKVLVEALLQDVLAAITKSRAYLTVLVVSPDQDIEVQARSNRATFLRQTSSGLNRAVEQAINIALRKNAESTTTILADIPLTTPEDLKEISNLAKTTPRVVMAPSLKGGTNIMATAPPGCVRPNYGRWSFSKHLRQAQIAATDAYSISNPRVSFDIDTMDDLVELRRRDPEGHTRSGKFALAVQHPVAVAKPHSRWIPVRDIE